MAGRMLTRAAVVAAGSIVSVAACSSSPPRQPDPPDVVVKASDGACAVAATSFTSGPLTLSVSNSGSGATDVAVYGAGDRMVGEVTDIGPSASKRLTVSLKAGAYDIVCDAHAGTGGVRTPITVQAPSGSSPTTSPQQNAAVATYRHYLQSQAALLITRLKPFADAVRAGDIQQARALYPGARQPYQCIEPVVQAMGDLAAGMDARINQVESGQEWTGFHRLEHDLFQSSDIVNDGPIADRLQADAQKVADQVPGIDLGADQVAAAARTLMQEAYGVQAVGAEELYSHLDLTDVASSTDGAAEAYRALRPIALAGRPALMAELDTAFSRLRTELAQYGSGADYASVDALTSTEVSTVRDDIEGVITPLARLSTLVVRS